MAPLVAVAVVVALALVFAFTNGFHDAANAVATSITTRALTPRIALAMAAALNLLGAFAGARVARTVESGLVEAPSGAGGLTLIAGALVGAIAWNLLTWWRGLPSSSSHALIGGLAGAALAAGAVVHWNGIVTKVVLPLVLSPLLGLVLGYAVMALVLWLFRGADATRAARVIRYAQTVSAAAVAFGHGMQDAAKTAGVVILTLVASGHRAAGVGAIPWWVLALAAVALAAGTYSGGSRIVRTLGRRIIALQPAEGLAAESSAAAVFALATATGIPVSTTHTIASAILGAGATRSRKAVRWDVVGGIGLAWVLTLPGAGLAAAAAYALLRLIA